MKSLDLRGAKKIASDNEKTTMEHPSGHHIVIMHKNLAPEHKKALDALPMCSGGSMQKYADGGQVKQAIPQPRPNKAAMSTTDKLIELAHHEKFGTPAYADGGGVQAATPGSGAPYGTDINGVALDPPGSSSSMEQPNNQPMQSPDAPSDPNGSSNLQPNAAGQQVNPYIRAQMLGNEGQQVATEAQMNAANQEADVAGQIGRASAGAATASNKRLDTAQALFNKEHAQNWQEVQDTADAMSKNLINPNQYVENMSVPARVTTALGMLISGIGGNNGSDNAAVKYLNDQIARNIDAQKANQGIRNNLISAYMAQGHSSEGAVQMAIATEKAHMANQVDAIAGKFGGAQAAAKASMIKAQLMHDAATGAQQASILKTAAALGQPAQPGQQAQSNGIPDAFDPNLENAYYVGGQKQYAANPKEAADLQEQSQFLDKYKQHLRDVDQFNKTQGSVLNPLGQKAGEAKALNDVGGTLLTETLTKGGAGVSRMAQRFANSGPQAGALLQDREGGKLAQSYKMIAEEQARLKQAGLKGGQPVLKMGK